MKDEGGSQSTGVQLERGRHPSSLILPPSYFILAFCGVAKLVRHRTVNAAMRRFESSRHSQTCRLPIGDCQLPLLASVILHA